MRRLLASFGLAVALATSVIGPTRAQTTDQMAMKVPLDVLEVVSGGEWRHDGGSGAYRVLVMLGQVGDAVQTSVYVQWIGTKSANSPLAIVRSVVIRDVSIRKLQAANVAIESETENQAVIVVSSVDPKTDKPIVLAYKATRPGVVETTDVPENYKPKEDAAPKN